MADPVPNPSQSPPVSSSVPASAIAHLASLTVDGLFDAVAAKVPAPGGGAVASVGGALGAALGSMVLAYSMGKKSLAEHADQHQAAADRLLRTRALLVALADEDAAAYAEVNRLQKLPEDNPERAAGWSSAVRTAVDVPRAVVAASADLLGLFESMCGNTNRWLASDLAIAAVLAEASARSGAWNVAVNLPLLTDETERGRLRAEVRGMVDRCRASAARVEARCADADGW